MFCSAVYDRCGLRSDRDLPLTRPESLDTAAEWAPSNLTEVGSRTAAASANLQLLSIDANCRTTEKQFKPAVCRTAVGYEP